MLLLPSLPVACRQPTTTLSLLAGALVALSAFPATAQSTDDESTGETTDDDRGTGGETQDLPGGEAEEAPAPAATVEDEASSDSEPTPEPVPAETTVSAPDPLASVARLISGSRVGGGVLVAPDQVITLLNRVGLGYLVDVRLGDGHRSVGRISRVDRARGLALVRLEDPAPANTVATLDGPPPRLGEEVRIVGHGGSVGLSMEEAELRSLTSFSTVHARVAAEAQAPPDDFDEPWSTNFLVDRTAGSGDEGCPVFSAAGAVLGILRQAVPGSGGRGVVASADDLRALLGAPDPPRAYRRPHHMQSWGGLGVAFHNRPSHVAGLVTLGLRIAFLDAIRLEPWFEVDLGSRAATQTPVARPKDFWWSVETGLSFGYRLPLFSEGNRSYVVPTAGLRLGWNRFQHSEQSLAPSCEDGDCSWVVQKTTDQERSFRAGIDVGVDVRHGKVRFGYRYFLSPADLQGHSMHRVVVTIDGWPIPIGLGDTH